MGFADTMRTWTHHHIQIDGRVVDYRVASSKTARRLRLRVGPNGVDVVQPTGRSNVDAAVFLESNGAWVLDQLQRAARLRGLRRSARRRASEILFRGEPTRVRVEATETRARGNAIDASGGEIVLRRGANSQTPVARSLETWLRKQARAEIQRHLAIVTTRLRQFPQPGSCNGPAYQVGQLLRAEEPLIQLAAHSSAGLRLAIPGDARGSSSGCS